MYNFEIIPNYNQLFNFITELDIFKKYCSNFIEINKLFISDLRIDKKPTCNIFYTGTNYRYKDFAESNVKNPLEYVKIKFNLNKDEAILKIIKDFNLNIEEVIYSKTELKNNLNTTIIPNSIIPNSIINKINKTSLIVNKRNFNIIDYNYWNQYYLDFETLDKFNVSAIDNVIYLRENQRHIFKYNKNNLIYSYYYNRNNEDYYKIYFPFMKERRFLFNGNSYLDIEGFKQLPEKDDLLIITKSLKDVMLLYKINYSSISFHGEANNIPKEIIESLLNRFDKIVILYDNDEAGIKGSNKIIETYPFIKRIEIPIKSKCKDISDFIKEKGLEKGKKLIKKLLKNVE